MLHSFQFPFLSCLTPFWFLFYCMWFVFVFPSLEGLGSYICSQCSKISHWSNLICLLHSLFRVLCGTFQYMIWAISFNYFKNSSSLFYQFFFSGPLIMGCWTSLIDSLTFLFVFSIFQNLVFVLFSERFFSMLSFNSSMKFSI